jgi:hypothetical protein
LVFDGSPDAQSAIVTGPSTVYRYYFYEHPTGQVGQLEGELNLLSRTPLHVDHGSVILDDDEEDVKPLFEQQFDWDDLSHYQIGVQPRCRVELRKAGPFMREVREGNQEVHQVFCGALNFAHVKRCRFTAAIARYLLEAEYRATILAACENARRYPGRTGSRTLVLQMLGGDGPFHNPLILICKALAACRDVIDGSGLSIFLVCEGDREFAVAEEHLKGLVEEFHGQKIQTKVVENEEDLEGEPCASKVVAVGVIVLLAWCALMVVLFAGKGLEQLTASARR